MLSLKKEKTKVEIDLTIDPKQWEEGVQKVYESSKSKFNIVGFRKGHAPRKVIEKQYGEGVFFEDTIEYFVNNALDEVLFENPELEPVAMPTTQFESYTKEAGLKMKIMFEIVPDFKLCDYKGVSIDVHHSTTTDAEVDHEIQHLLQDNARFETVDREIKNGDNVLIDFVGSIDGVEFEGGSAKNCPLEIGSHSFIDNFEDQLIGSKTGDSVDVVVTFPKEYGVADLQGKEALFKVVVNAVREKVVPVLDDKFVSDTTEFETVDEYRKHIFAHIQTMKDNEIDNEFQYNMRQYLIDNTEIEIPEIMVETQIRNNEERMREALKAYNLSFEEYLIQTGSNIEEYSKTSKERTLKSIKTRYIYRKLIDENKIEVSAQELESATKGMTDRQDVLQKENELLLEKLHKFLKDNNKMKIIEE